MPNFFFLLAGEKFSEMVETYSLGHDDDEIDDMEDEMDSGKEGHKTFDDCEAEAKVAIREAEVPFAIVFRGSKIYAYVAHDKTSTFEAI
jgi:hypothetical protein